jgi:TetR/AcrR family transcriptional regulator, regulator of cefoperazone and chloramphenicol sensitivity
VAATTQDTRSRGDATREALVSAATAVFSRDGFHAASTRAIAEAAGVQQALIGYHFQGKEGLYLAVFEHIAGQLRARLGPVADAIEEALERPTKPKSLRAHRLGLLLKMVDNAIALMVRDESAQWAQLIIREQAEPTQAFEVLYEGYMGRMLDLMTGLVRSVRGCSRQDARLSTLTIIGQMLVFRVARAGVSRQLGWSTIRPKELAIVQAHLRTTISAQLLSAPRKGPR